MTEKKPNPEPAPPRRAVVNRPATGRSFVLLIIVASVCAIGVTIWRLYSLTEGARNRGMPSRLRI